MRYTIMGTANNVNDVEYFRAEIDSLMHGWISAFHILYPETTICVQTRQNQFKCQFKCQNLTHRASWKREWPYFLWVFGFR